MEVALKNNLNALVTREYAELQQCEIIFDYSKTLGVNNIQARRFSKDPGFEYLAQKAVLGLNNDPTVKIPEILSNKRFPISAMFFKSKEITSVNVRSGEYIFTRGASRLNTQGKLGRVDKLGNVEPKSNNKKPVDGSLPLPASFWKQVPPRRYPAILEEEFR